MNKESEMGEVNHNNRAFDDLVAEMKRDHPSEMALAGEWAAGWADGVKHGAAQIDALRAENAELVAALETLNSMFPLDIDGQRFVINSGPPIQADGDTLFFSSKKVVAFLDDFKNTIDAALAKHRGDK